MVIEGDDHALKQKVTFVVAVNDREVFRNNFLASACLRATNHHEVLVQEKFASAGTAYNDALERSTNDLTIFCHQDLYLPERWLSDLSRALFYLELFDSNWGVLGCSGITVDRRHPRHVYSPGLGVSGAPFARPEAVQTLDEIVLIMRKSSGLRFDENLPHFHLYGADICLRAAQLRMRSYAISAFCIHNTEQGFILPPEFYNCCRYMRRVWKDSLPIQTTCIRITKAGVPIWLRKLRESYLRHVRRQSVERIRTKQVQQLLDECMPRVANLKETA